MPRRDIPSAKNTEGRGRQVDAYGFLNQMEQIPSGPITPLDPKLQKGEIQAGSVTQGKSANIVGGGNSTELANLLNVVVDAAPKVAQSIKTVQEVHDKKIIEDETKAFQQRKTATAEELSEQGQEIRTWGELSLTERAEEEAAHLKKIQEQLWSKNNKFFFGTKITENTLARPTLSADELLLTMKEQRLAILASDVDEDTKIDQLTELTESMYNALQLNETIQKDEEAADKVRLGLYAAEIEDDGLVEDALDKYLKETMPGVSERIEEFTNQLLTSGDEESVLANPESFWPAFVEWAGPALQEPFQSDEAFVEAFTEKYTPEYVKIRETATQKSLERLRLRAIAETEEETAIAARAMESQLKREGERLTFEQIRDMDFLSHIAKGWSKMKDYGNVDVAQTHLVQALSSIVVPASLNHGAHFTDTPLQAVDRTLENLIEPWLKSTGFNFTEAQIKNTLSRIKRNVEGQLLNLDNSPYGAAQQVTTESRPNGETVTTVETNIHTLITATSNKEESQRKVAVDMLSDQFDQMFNSSFRSSVNESFLTDETFLKDVQEVANLTHDDAGRAAFTGDILTILAENRDDLFTESGRNKLIAEIINAAKIRGERDVNYTISDRLQKSVRTLVEKIGSEQFNLELHGMHNVVNSAYNTDTGFFSSENLDRNRLAQGWNRLSGDTYVDFRKKAGIQINKDGKLIFTDDPYGLVAQQEIIMQSRQGSMYISDSPGAVHTIMPFDEVGDDLSNPAEQRESAVEMFTELSSIFAKEASIMGEVGFTAKVMQDTIEKYIEHKVSILPGTVDTDKLVQTLLTYSTYSTRVSKQISELESLGENITEDQKAQLDQLKAAFVQKTKTDSEEVASLLANNTIYSNRGFEIIETDRQFFDGSSGAYEDQVGDIGAEGYAFIAKQFRNNGLAAIANMRFSDGQSMLAAYAQSTDREYTMASFLGFMKKNHLTFTSRGEGRDFVVEIVRDPRIEGGYMYTDGLNSSVFSLGIGDTAQSSDIPLAKTSPMFVDPNWQRNFVESAEFAVAEGRIQQRDADAMTGLVAGLGRLDPEDINARRLASFLTRSDVNSAKYLELEKMFLPLFSDNPDSLNLFRALVVPQIAGFRHGGFDISLSDLYNLDLKMQQIASLPSAKQDEERQVLYNKESTTPSLRNRTLWRNPEVSFNQSATGNSRFTVPVTKLVGEEYVSESLSPVFFDTDMRTINRLHSGIRLSEKNTRYTFVSSPTMGLGRAHKSTPDITKDVPTPEPQRRELSEAEKGRIEKLRIKQQEQDRFSETGMTEFMRLEQQINEILYGKTVVPLNIE